MFLEWHCRYDHPQELPPQELWTATDDEMSEHLDQNVASHQNRQIGSQNLERFSVSYNDFLGSYVLQPTRMLLLLASTLPLGLYIQDAKILGKHKIAALIQCLSFLYTHFACGKWVPERADHARSNQQRPVWTAQNATTVISISLPPEA